MYFSVRLVYFECKPRIGLLFLLALQYFSLVILKLCFDFQVHLYHGTGRTVGGGAVWWWWIGGEVGIYSKPFTSSLSFGLGLSQTITAQVVSLFRVQ